MVASTHLTYELAALEGALARADGLMSRQSLTDRQTESDKQSLTDRQTDRQKGRCY